MGQGCQKCECCFCANSMKQSSGLTKLRLNGLLACGASEGVLSLDTLEVRKGTWQNWEKGRLVPLAIQPCRNVFNWINWVRSSQCHRVSVHILKTCFHCWWRTCQDEGLNDGFVASQLLLTKILVLIHAVPVIRSVHKQGNSFSRDSQSSFFH